MKNGTDKKGPQINRNDCEGPQGRTTLMVFFFIYLGCQFTIISKIWKRLCKG